MSTKPTRRSFFGLGLKVLGALAVPAPLLASRTLRWDSVPFSSGGSYLRHRIRRALIRGMERGDSIQVMQRTIRRIFEEA